MTIRRVCVFCGASSGRDPRHAAFAREVGAGLARRGLALVYGGGRVGLMGAVAAGALAEGGEVHGVIPSRLVDRELAHPGVTELHVVETLHERKARMAELSDAFVALAGGLGTLEELAEVLSWAQLELHDKPVGLLDPTGYYEPLASFLDRAVEEAFLGPDHRALLAVERDLGALLERFENHRPPRGRWDRPSGDPARADPAGDQD